MSLRDFLLGRRKQKKGRAKDRSDAELEDNGRGFFHKASHTAFNAAVTMNDQSTTIDKSTTVIEKLTNINYIEQGKPVLESLSREMIQGADVDSSARYPPPQCYPGTRTSLIAKGQNWLLDDQRTWDILWLHGPAGVGKSAVAQTLAEFAKDNHRLGAAFFFSKTNGRNDPQRVFITIAYQLSVRFPGYLPLVAVQLAADPDLLKKAPHVQFRQLIIEPLSSLTSHPKHLIVLDGLDECKGERAQLDIVELINNLILSQTSLPIIWMICSRPEPHLMRTVSRPDFIVQCWREELPIDTEESRDDTARFIRARFKEMHEDYRDCVEEDANGCWPGEDDIAFIIKEASGLFVFASTILKYIEDAEAGNPSGRLADILAAIRHVHVIGGRSPMETLDALYTRILSDVPDNIWPVTHRLLKIAISKLSRHSDNTPQFLSNFLGITRSDFYTAVRKLHSVLDVPPPNEGANRPLRSLHASFRDYLVQPARSGRFCVTLPPGFTANDEAQKSSLRITGSLTSFLAEGLDHSIVDLRPSPLTLVEPKGHDILNKCLPWPGPDPEPGETASGTPAWNIAAAASDLIFSSYSEFQTHDDCHQELKTMLRAFDFNCLAFLYFCWDMVPRQLPDLIHWMKRTSLCDMARTHSTCGTDDNLLLRLNGLAMDVEPLDFTHISVNRSFAGLRKLAYFLLGHDTNTVLVIVDGSEWDKSWFRVAKYHSVKTPLDIWPSLAALLA